MSAALLSMRLRASAEIERAVKCGATVTSCAVARLGASLVLSDGGQEGARDHPTKRLGLQINGGSNVTWPIVWEKGLALEAMCCATKDWGQPRTWCSEEQLACSDTQLQGVKIYVLDAPYSSENQPDWGHYCYAAVHENVIIALWHRNWT